MHFGNYHILTDIAQPSALAPTLDNALHINTDARPRARRTIFALETYETRPTPNRLPHVPKRPPSGHDPSGSPATAAYVNLGLERVNNVASDGLDSSPLTRHHDISANHES